MINDSYIRNAAANGMNFVSKSIHSFNKQTLNLTNLFFLSVFLGVVYFCFRSISRSRVTQLEKNNSKVNAAKEIAKAALPETAGKSTQTNSEHSPSKADHATTLKPSIEVTQNLDHQYTATSDQLSPIFKYEHSALNPAEQALMENLHSFAADPDSTLLKEALIKMTEADKTFFLNRFYKEKTPLNIAASAGHLDNVKLLVENSAKDALKTQDTTNEIGKRPLQKLTSEDGIHGYTALFSAANSGHYQIVKYLLENGAKIRDCEKEENNLPFLPKLIKSRLVKDDQKYLECLRLIIFAWKKQLGEEQFSEHTNSTQALEKALRLALKYKNFSIVELLLTSGVAKNLLPPNFFWDLISKSILENNLEMIKFLHTKQLIDFAKYRLPKNTGDTLLTFCYALKCDTIFNYLADTVGVPKDVKNAKGQLWEDAGKEMYQEMIFRLLIQHIESDDPSFQLETEGIKIHSFEAALKELHDINRPDLSKDDRTLLHVVVRKLDFEYSKGEFSEFRVNMIYQLIQLGARVDIKDKLHCTPLYTIERLLNEENHKLSGSLSLLIKKNPRLETLEKLIKTMKNTLNKDEEAGAEVEENEDEFE